MTAKAAGTAGKALKRNERDSGVCRRPGIFPGTSSAVLIPSFFGHISVSFERAEGGAHFPGRD